MNKEWWGKSEIMFIWCKVKEKGKQCLLQSWAVGSPFSQVFRCPVHGLVNADGYIK